jgi:DNA primase catalytic core, N-terminal domain
MLDQKLKLGRRFCPECDSAKEKSPSISLNTAGFTCFRCGLSGSYAKALTLLEGEPAVFREVDKDLKQAAETAWAVYSHHKDLALPYLLNRGYPQQIENVEFGFAPSNKTLLKEGLSWNKIVSLGLASSTKDIESFNQRVVFVIRNAFGEITHFQARAVDPNSRCKWLASTESGLSKMPISSTLYNEHKIKAWQYKKVSLVFLCEGITDALALEVLGLPVLATFGIQHLQLHKHQELYNLNIIASYDNDRHEFSTSKLSGLEKSWPIVLPQLACLQRQLEAGCEIHILQVPKVSGIKDMFDLCQYLNWEVSGLLEFTQQETKPLAEKIVQSFGIDHVEIIKHLAGIHISEEIKLGVEASVNKRGGWLNAIAAAFY